MPSIDESAQVVAHGAAAARDRSLTLDRAAGEALDQAVEKQIVHQADRDGDDQGGGQERLPEEDVAQDQLGGDADAQGTPLGAGDEDQGVDELVQGERD